MPQSEQQSTPETSSLPEGMRPDCAYRKIFPQAKWPQIAAASPCTTPAEEPTTSEYQFDGLGMQKLCRHHIPKQEHQ